MIYVNLLSKIHEISILTKEKNHIQRSFVLFHGNFVHGCRKIEFLVGTNFRNYWGNIVSF